MSQPPSNEVTERAAFEAALIEAFPYLNEKVVFGRAAPGDAGDGDYMLSLTETGWRMWKVGRTPTAAIPSNERDLVMLVSRLAIALKRTGANNELSDKASDYLKRKDLIGSPLRAAGKCPGCHENLPRCVCFPTDDGPGQPGAVDWAQLDEVTSFLMGSTPLEGVTFGERHPTKAGLFWWRLNLRAALCRIKGG